MQYRMLDDDPRRRQLALQQGAEAETRGHFRKGGERFPIRVGDSDVFELQIELPTLAIDPETRPGNRDLHPAAGPVYELLDIGGQRVEVDWSLRQAPQHEPAHKDQCRRGCAQPRQNTARTATHPPRR